MNEKPVLWIIFYCGKFIVYTHTPLGNQASRSRFHCHCLLQGSYNIALNPPLEAVATYGLPEASTGHWRRICSGLKMNPSWSHDLVFVFCGSFTLSTCGINWIGLPCCYCEDGCLSALLGENVRANTLDEPFLKMAVKHGGHCCAGVGNIVGSCSCLERTICQLVNTASWTRTACASENLGGVAPPYFKWFQAPKQN